MDNPHTTIRDVKLITTGTEQEVAIEFANGNVKTFTAKQLYEASRFLHQPQAQAETRTASQRRAEELLSMRKGRRR